MSQMNSSDPRRGPGESHEHEELEDGRPHKPADDKEEIYFEGSPLLRAHFGTMLLCAIGAAILLAIPILVHMYAKDSSHRLPWWAWLICIGLAALCMIIPMLLVRSIRYRITNYRIDFERGILGKNIHTLELWHVEDIKYHQSFLDRILNVGDIEIMSHDDTTPDLRLKGVPNPRPLFESLKQRVIAVKRQRGVIKMDVGQ